MNVKIRPIANRDELRMALDLMADAHIQGTTPPNMGG